ncbi:hypothetical protein [Gymnodinialimonas sp.]
MTERILGRCSNCFDADGQLRKYDGTPAVQPAAPAGPNEIVAKPAEKLLTVAAFTTLGLWLHELKIDVPIGLRNDKRPFSVPMVRWMVAYALYGGLEKGIQYRWSCGCPLVIAPETIDEVFDGKKTEYLPVTEDWSDDPISYDRGIRFWVERAVAGEITEPPGEHWLGRLTLIQLCRDVLASEQFNDG